MKTRAGLLLLLVVLGLGVAGGGWTLNRQIHAEGFCDSCHLPDGDRLHGRKMDLMTATPPGSLAGAHFDTGPGERLHCPDCHHGTTPEETVVIMTDAALNTLRYYFADYGEPEHLKVPIPDRFCDRCHQDLATSVPFGSFHASWSHGELKVLDHEIHCTDCHRMHRPRPDTGDSFLHRDETLEQCDLCHGRAMNRESVVIGLERDLGLRE